MSTENSNTKQPCTIDSVRVRCCKCKSFSEEKDDDYRWKYVSCSEGEFHMMRVNSSTLDTFKECDKFNAL
jgi:hypothetical protein